MTETTEKSDDLAQTAREHLDTIRKGWRHVLDPIKVESGGSVQTGIRPATEDELEVPPDARLDTPTMLAFWVHAAVDEWPSILDRPEHVPQPTTDPDAYPGWTIRMTTVTVDCSSIYDMCDLLTREADRLASWVDESGHDYGATFVTELEAIARAVAKVAWPPKGDRMVIGDCPACGRRLRVKAPPWHRVPCPTTDPEAYPAWSRWQPLRDRPITCRCGAEDDLDGWHARLTSLEARKPKTAAELIDIIAAAGFARYKSPAVVRQWARQGLIVKVKTSERGESMFDSVQVLAALADRERRAERAS